MPVWVLICDDSALVRAMLDRTLREVPGVEVAGKTADGLQAVEAVARGGIDVVVLDVELRSWTALRSCRASWRPPALCGC